MRILRLVAEGEFAIEFHPYLAVVTELDGDRRRRLEWCLFEGLERMAGAVQIVHITDDPRIVEWGNSLEDGRGGVVRPVSAKADAL